MENNEMLINEGNVYLIRSKFRLSDYKAVILEEPKRSPTREEGLMLSLGFLFLCAGLLIFLLNIAALSLIAAPEKSAYYKMVFEFINGVDFLNIYSGGNIVIIISVTINAVSLTVMGYSLIKAYLKNNYDIYLTDEFNMKALIYSSRNRKNAFEIYENINRMMLSKQSEDNGATI